MLAGTDQTAGEWQTLTLGDCAVINAATYSPKEAWPFVNYLDTGNITENRISEVQHLVAGKHSIPSRARRKVQPGDIVYSTVRPDQRHFGLLKDPPANCLVSTAFAVLRGKAGRAHTDFLYWFLVQAPVVERLHTIAEHSVTAYPSIRPADIARLELRLPPLAEQRTIAHILGTLDAKIEVNRRMNATLDDIARALFTSWFVHFDPVRAKAALTQRASPGGGAWPVARARARAYLDRLEPALAAVFPDSFVDSELGPIPAGWTVKPLAALIELRYGQALKAANRRAGPVPVYGSNGRVGWHDEPLIAGPSIIVGRKGTPGTVTWAASACFPIDTTFYAVPKDPSHSLPFLFYALQGQGLPAVAADSAVPGLNRHLASLNLQVTPPAPVVAHFVDQVESFFARWHSLEEESRTLTALRDTLLPKLLSGQIRVHAGSPPA